MQLRFRRRLYRERRRLALFGLLVTLAAFLIYSADLGSALGIRHAAFSALGTGLGASLIALGLLLLAPGWRKSLETVAITTFLYAVVIIRVPGLSFHDERHSLIAFVGFLVAATLIHLGLYGRWSDRFLRLPMYVERTTAITRLPRQVVWEAAFPAPATQTKFWDPTVERITPVRDHPESVILKHRFGNGMMLDQLITFDQVNPGQSFRYSYEIVGGRQRGPQACVVVLEARDRWLALHLRWERSGYPLRLALMHWIDDWGGRSVDAQLERLEAAERGGYAQGVLSRA